MNKTVSPPLCSLFSCAGVVKAGDSLREKNKVARGNTGDGTGAILLEDEQVSLKNDT